MEKDCLEANLMQGIPILKAEGDINLSAVETLNMGLINKPTEIVLDEVGTASKMVHQFYFVKFWPYKDPDEASKISEAEKIIEELDQKRIQIFKELKLLRSKRIDLFPQLTQQRNRSSSITYGLEWQNRMLDHLQVVLDKLNFAKIVHKGHNTHDFQSWMLHGRSNLATEKRLLREITRSQQSLNSSDLDPFTSLFKQYLQWYSYRWNFIDKARYTQMLEKMKQIEERKEKALADSAKQGNIWNPLSVRNAIQEQIKIVNKISVELRRQQCEVTATILRLEKDLGAIRKEWRFHEDHLWEMRCQEDEAKKSIRTMGQLSNEMNGRYHEYLSQLSSARELASKKDIAALRKLADEQVKEFMFEWNRPYHKTFRLCYEISILPSLHNRQLRMDGLSATSKRHLSILRAPTYQITVIFS